MCATNSHSRATHKNRSDLVSCIKGLRQALRTVVTSGEGLPPVTPPPFHKAQISGYKRACLQGGNA